MWVPVSRVLVLVLVLVSVPVPVPAVLRVCCVLCLRLRLRLRLCLCVRYPDEAAHSAQQLTQVRDEKRQTAKELRAAQSELTTLRQQKQDAETAAARAASAAAAREAELVPGLAHEREARAAAETARKAAEGRVDVVEAQLQSACRTHEKRVASLDAEVESLRKQAAVLRDRVSAQAKSVAEQRRGRLTAEAEAEATRDTAEREAAQAARELASARAEVERAQTERASLSTELEGLQKDMAAAREAKVRVWNVHQDGWRRSNLPRGCVVCRCVLAVHVVVVAASPFCASRARPRSLSHHFAVSRSCVGFVFGFGTHTHTHTHTHTPFLSRLQQRTHSPRVKPTSKPPRPVQTSCTPSWMPREAV